MKSKIIALTTTTLLGTISMGSAFAADLDNRMYIGGGIGQGKVTFDSEKVYSGMTYGVVLGDRLTIDSNKQVQFELSATHGLKDKIEDKKVDIKIYDANLKYKHQFDVGETVKLTPIVGLGYETKKIEDIKSNRTYAEVGLESDFAVSEDWTISPSVIYQRDISASVKAGNEKLETKKGNGYKVAVNFNKDFVVSQLDLTPYYKRHDQKVDGGKLKTDSYGVEVRYTF